MSEFIDVGGLRFGKGVSTLVFSQKVFSQKVLRMRGWGTQVEIRVW